MAYKQRNQNDNVTLQWLDDDITKRECSENIVSRTVGKDVLDKGEY